MKRENKGRSSDFHNNPRLITDKELRGNLCKGLVCRRCECLDKCQWGAEAIRRGLINPAEETRGRKPVKKEAPVVEERRDRPTLAVKPVGMADRWEIREILGISECTWARYRNLYSITPDAGLNVGRSHPVELYWPTKVVEVIASGMVRQADSAIKRTMMGKQIIKMRESVEEWIRQLEEQAAIHELIVNGCPEAGIK